MATIDQDNHAITLRSKEVKGGEFMGYWIVKLKNNETMNFDWKCHYVDCTSPNVAVFSSSPSGYLNEEVKATEEPLAMIPYHMIEYIKFIKED